MIRGRFYRHYQFIEHAMIRTIRGQSSHHPRLIDHQITRNPRPVLVPHSNHTGNSLHQLRRISPLFFYTSAPVWKKGAEKQEENEGR